MAINKNHEFEDLDGVKCSIAEKNASTARVDFLKQLLTINGYTVVVVKSPPPKTAAPKVVATSTTEPAETTPPIPDTYTIGVTDLTFNPTNAIFGRLLRTSSGHIVTPAYWDQKDRESHDEVPYYEVNAQKQE